MTMLENEHFYFRPFANNQLNSRLSVPYMDYKWQVKWSSNLDPFFPSKFIMIFKDKYLVIQGNGWWKLFDLDGKLLKSTGLGNSDIIIDEENNFVYSFDRFGFFDILNLTLMEQSNKVFVNGTSIGKEYFLPEKTIFYWLQVLRK